MKPAAPPPSRLALALLFPFQACDQQSLHGTSLKPTSGFFLPGRFFSRWLGCRRDSRTAPATECYPFRLANDVANIVPFLLLTGGL